MNQLFRRYIFFLFFLCGINCFAQHNTVNVAHIKSDGFKTAVITDTSGHLIVNQITIKGNKKTRNYIISREINFKSGDTIQLSKLEYNLEKIRQQIYNTLLFVYVNISATVVDSSRLNIEVVVLERWYIYPSPHFQVNARDYNEWFNRYNANLNRVTYGIKFTHSNLTGRRDQLRIYFLTGYSKNILFSYSLPYINKALTKGLSVSGGFSQNKDVIVKSARFDSIVIFPSLTQSTGIPKDVFKNYYLRVGYTVRKAIRVQHNFTIGYSRIEVNDSVIHPPYNPNYFGMNSSNIGFLDLSYTYSYQFVDNSAYPLKGLTGYFNIAKRGIDFTGGVNYASIEGGINKYIRLKRNWYTSFQGLAKIKAPFDLAYINQKALGYGDANLRGLERYVIDGPAYALARNTLKKKILSFNVNLPFNIKIKSVPFIPFTFFLKTYADAGFVHNIKKYSTSLNNKFLYTGGFGIDLLSLYDSFIKIEYSFNQLGKNGVFLTGQISF